MTTIEVLLRTRCGCEKIIKADRETLGYSILVPLLPKMSAFTPRPPTPDGCVAAWRTFKRTPNFKDDMPIYEEPN